MSVSVERFGQGPDLVLLHGWGMNGAVWHGITQQLAAYYRVHLVDLPGFGNSPLADEVSMRPTSMPLAALTVTSAPSLRPWRPRCSWIERGRLRHAGHGWPHIKYWETADRTRNRGWKGSTSSAGIG